MIYKYKAYFTQILELVGVTSSVWVAGRGSSISVMRAKEQVEGGNSLFEGEFLVSFATGILISVFADA